MAGPPTPPPPPPRPPRPEPHPVDPRRPRVLAAVAAVLAVISTAVVHTWVARSHYGDALTPALALAGFGLYLIVSALFVRRRTYVLVEPSRPRSEDKAAGVAASPGPTPAATNTAGAA